MMIIAAVDCAKTAKFCQREHIHESPSIFVYQSSVSDVPSGQAISIKLPTMRMIDAITRKMESNVIQISMENWEDIKHTSRSENLHIFIIVSSRATTSPLIKSLSTVIHYLTLGI